MRRLGEERGLSLIELLVAMSVMLLVMGALFSVLEVFMRVNNTNQARNEGQDVVRTALDRISSDLRNAASACTTQTGGQCSSTVASTLQRATAYDVIMQEVDTSTVFGSADPSNQEWVRYCLDAGNPSNETLWREVLTPPSGSALPAMPTTTACPGTGTATDTWPSATALLTNVTNQINTQNRPLFQFYIPSGTSAAKSMDIDVFVNQNPAAAHPGETELRDGVGLRNSLAAPTSSFTYSLQSGNVVLDGTGSTDPNGQALAFRWYVSVGSTTSCPPSGVAAAANTPTYNAGVLSGTYSFALVVTDSAGLSSCSTQTASF